MNLNEVLSENEDFDLGEYDPTLDLSSYKYLESDGYSVEFNPSLNSSYPTEEKKWSPFTAHHQFPYTLEQEVVKKMAPIRNKNYSNEKYTFKPILDDLHDAAPINYRGVI
jgi:hypothetical protein